MSLVFAVLQPVMEIAVWSMRPYVRFLERRYGKYIKDFYQQPDSQAALRALARQERADTQLKILSNVLFVLLTAGIVALGVTIAAASDLGILGGLALSGLVALVTLPLNPLLHAITLADDLRSFIDLPPGSLELSPTLILRPGRDWRGRPKPHLLELHIGTLSRYWALGLQPGAQGSNIKTVLRETNKGLSELVARTQSSEFSPQYTLAGRTSIGSPQRDRRWGFTSRPPTLLHQVLLLYPLALNYPRIRFMMEHTRVMALSKMWENYRIISAKAGDLHLPEEYQGSRT